MGKPNNSLTEEQADLIAHQLMESPKTAAFILNFVEENMGFSTYIRRIIEGLEAHNWLVYCEGEGKEKQKFLYGILNFNGGKAECLTM